MPFIKKDGQTYWMDSTVDDVKVVEREIIDALSLNPKVKAVIKKEKVLSESSRSDEDLDVSSKYAFIGPNSSFQSSLSVLVKEGIRPVDIVLPIYGSIHIAAKCIDAVISRTNWPYNLIIVDDASDDYTVNYLKTKKFPDNVRVLFNTKNRGFAATVNRGIKAGSSPYICFLNSDVLVTPGWLTKLVMALESSSKNQIVNPITNNTALINVEMQEGYSYLDMNRAFERTSRHDYPEIMPTGFCFLFRRSLAGRIGLLDEAYKNYGEETDYWMKVITYLENGYYMKQRAVLADDTYVFHERGSSFSSLGDAEHMTLRRTSNDRFHKLWPQYRQWIKGHNAQQIMAPYREPFSKKVIDNRESDYKICWVVRSTAMCGGMKYIADIVNEINERGGDARVALVLRNEETAVQTLSELRCAPIVFKSDMEFVETFSQRVFKNGVVVAAISELAFLVEKVCKNNPGLTGVNHVQSYDPAIAPDEGTKAMAHKSYDLLPFTVSNSNKITKVLESDHKITPLATIHPGIDRSLFYPRNRSKGDDRPTVLLSLNPSYPFKGYNRGIELAKQLFKKSLKLGIDLRIMAYGVDVVPDSPFILCLGPISQVRLATLLGTEVDVFVDPSSYHSYGLPSLEAMASGVPVVSWDNGGIQEFGRDKENCLIFPNDTPEMEMADSIIDLLKDDSLRKKLAFTALSETIPNHCRDNSISTFISTIETSLYLSFPKRRIVFVTPHLRKHGGPTTIIRAANELARRGHDVSISCVYSDINPEVTVQSRVPISIDIKNIPTCEVLLVNSDNPDSNYFANLPQAKKKILYKLSHNERFVELENSALKHPWDRIITSTQWLADVCKNPTKGDGWDYSPREAERVGWFHYGHGTFKKHPSSREYGSQRTSFIVTTLVHHHPLKGTKEVLEVLDKLQRKYKLECVGVGEIPPGKVKLPEWVTYITSPNRRRMADVFRQTDVWIGGSRTEGLGRMALEAMSAGIACVLSDTGAEFAVDGENCLLYPVGDMQKLEEQVERLLNSPELMQKIVNNAYLTAEAVSDPTEFTLNLERVINEVCQKN